MFERYSERARRVLFFARYELTTLGGREIGPEHILLGVLREQKGLIGSMFAEWKVPLGELRRQLETGAPHGDRLASSIEAAFTKETKRALNLAAQEADRLLHYSIEPVHLVLALLHDNSVASKSLQGYGMTLEKVREYVATHAAGVIEPGGAGDAEALSPDARAEARSRASIHIQRIMELVRELQQAEPDSTASRELVVRIDDELIALQRLYD